MCLSEIKKILLIGNGPSALEHNAGNIIDNFPHVLRFNYFYINGYEKYVGTKCDFWSTTDRFPEVVERIKVRHTFFITGRVRYQEDMNTADFLKQSTIQGNCTILDGEYLSNIYQKMGAWPSSGAIITNYMLDLNIEVLLYGFNFFCGYKHHYGDNIDLGPNHDKIKEKQYFLNLYKLGKIRFLFEEDAIKVLK